MKRFCAILIGLVFFTSGLLKIIDPTGSRLIVESYADFFHIGFLKPLSGFVAVLLPALEALVGLALLSGVFKRITAKLTIALTAFFTVITMILAIFQPEMDCGCFGEAIHMSHTATLVKNLVLCALAAAAFTPLPDESRHRIQFYLLGTATIALGLYSFMYLPLWDFTDFSAGNRIYDAAHPFPDAENQDPGFIYEKEGQSKTFTLDNLPDSTWTFAGVEDFPKRLAPSNIVPLTDAAGRVCDSLLLGGRILAVTAYNVDDLSHSDWKNVARLLESAAAGGLKAMFITAPAPEGIDAGIGQLSKEEGLRIQMSSYYSDRKVLMTLNRSNGGATLIDEGMIIWKWPSRSLDSDRIVHVASQDCIVDTFVKKSMKDRLVLCIFWMACVILSLATYRKNTDKCKKTEEISR